MLVVADDLTGAADTAAAFVGNGRRCTVVLGGPTLGRPEREIETETQTGREVVAVDTNGRSMSEADAVAATVAAITRHRGRRLYLKIDSTGRGHIRATVEAAIATMGRRPSRVVVCPALPALGRTVAGGWIHLDGRPLVGGDLGTMFAGFRRDVGLLIADARDDCDLAAVVASITTSSANVLWVGSAGLARHLAEHDDATITPPAAAEQHPIGRPLATTIVVVAGSQHVRTDVQLARLEDDVEVLRIDPRDRSLLERARPTIAAADGLVLTGGHTARVVLDLLGVSSFAVCGEVEIGVPWGLATGTERRIAIVTKAGGFGDEHSLHAAVEFLSRAH